MAKTTRKTQLASTENYDHKEQQALIRPDVGLQAQFKKKKPAKTYKYDSSLDPELSWDISADRERAESLIAKIAEAKNLEEAKASARQAFRRQPSQRHALRHPAGSPFCPAKHEY